MAWASWTFKTIWSIHGMPKNTNKTHAHKGSHTYETLEVTSLYLYNYANVWHNKNQTKRKHIFERELEAVG